MQHESLNQFQLFGGFDYGPEMNGLLFDGSSYLSKTFSGAADDASKQIIGMWVRPTAFGATKVMIAAGNNTNDFTQVSFVSSDVFEYYQENSNSATSYLVSDAVYRDPTSWMLIIFSYDSDEASSSDRLQFYQNGVSRTLTENNAIDSARSTFLLDAVINTIGRASFVGSAFFEGFMSQVFAIDGASIQNSDYSITDFYQTDSQGQIYPKSVAQLNAAITWGTNGFLLDFADSADIGNDVSGNGNDWTPNGFASSDVVTESPTLIHPVLNPLANSNLTLREAGTAADGDGVSAWDWASCTMPMLSGKFYWEVYIDDLDSSEDHTIIGISGFSIEHPQAGDYLTINADHYAIQWDSADTDIFYGNNNSFPTLTDTGNLSVADVVQVAFDADTGKLWFGLNNTWFDSGDPGSGTNQIFTVNSAYAPYAPALSLRNTNSATMRFREEQWSYSAPTGFTALNNRTMMGEPVVKDASEEFVSVKATEANIVSSLATARSGWSSYVDIFKNRDTSESWYWRFSSDSSNCFNSDSTDARESFPTLSGSDNWIGYSLKVDGNANIKAGSVSHTNGGGDTTVTHNAGNARCLIILFPQAGGARPLYHPELTSGDLLYLDTTVAETLDSAIKNVTSTSFDIDTGEATDTYWYIVIPETDGFCRLFKQEGNASADGTVQLTGISPLLAFLKSIDSTSQYFVYDDQREGYNVDNDSLYFDIPSAEGTSDEIDRLAGGIKCRIATDPNVAETYVGMVIGNPAGGENVNPAMAA